MKNVHQYYINKFPKEAFINKSQTGYEIMAHFTNPAQNIRQLVI